MLTETYQNPEAICLELGEISFTYYGSYSDHRTDESTD